MNYLTLSSRLRKNKLYIFTLRDIKNLFSEEKEKTIKNNFIRWVDKGYCVRLKKNLYEFAEPGSELTIPDLYVANRLYEPSYVSLETALSFYSIIPDISAGVTSLTTQPTRRFKNSHGSFFYHSCKKEVFIGYRLIKYEGFNVYIADKEKALIDFLYFRLRSGFAIDFKEERLNKKILKNLNWKRASYYARLFNQKTLRTLKKCREYLEC